MIYVSFIKENRRLVSFNIEGHAGFDQHGEDIVCSAVSALSITMANGITEVLKVNAACDIKDGFLSLDLRNLTLDDIEKCSVLMETMLLGLKSMEVNYGDYISVRVEEV